MGLDLETVRMEVEKTGWLWAGDQDCRQRSLHAAGQKVLALAGKEAKALNHSYVGTEHILLGFCAKAKAWLPESSRVSNSISNAPATRFLKSLIQTHASESEQEGASQRRKTSKHRHFAHLAVT